MNERTEVRRTLRILLASALLACCLQLTSPAEAVQWQATAADGAVSVADGAVSAADGAVSVADGEVSRERSRLRLILIDAEGLSPEVSGVLHREITTILAAAGVDVDVVSAEQASGESVDVHATSLKVVLLAEDGRRFGVGDGHMGVNLIVGGRPNDTVYVFVPVVRKALGRELRTGRRREREQIGRALGRVTAHEVVHALAPDVPHASTGVMKATPNTRDLVAADVRLDAFASDRIRQALDRRIGALAR